MLLLNSHSLTPVRKVPVESMSIQLKERESTATLTPADMTGITVGSWLKDETEPGAGIVWRVKSIAYAYATNTPTLQLEHIISTLKDRILFGEHKSSDITGNSKATSCTSKQAVTYILNQQSDWVLGTFSFGNANPYKFDGDTLFDALETVTNSLENAWWSYDLSRYPFRLNITLAGDSVGSEMRAGRNLRTITKTIDRSGMFTRFYPIGADDLHIDRDYVEKNTAAYGVVSKVETDTSIDNKDELRRWANERLAKHCEPTVTIEIEGLELSGATGESMDRLTLGRVCRIPLPEFGTTIQERITVLNFSDKIHQPEIVKVTLSNERAELTRIIADSIKSSSKSTRTSTKKDKEDHAWFEDTNDHVSMCAKAIIGTDAQGNANWVRLSTLRVDENGIYGEVKSVQNDVTIASTRITQNEKAITLEAQRASSAEGALSSRLTITANAITQEVTRATSAEGTLSGRITTEADRISLVVSGEGANAKIKPASIVASINDSSSSVLISANKIRLDGNTTVAGMLTVESGALKVKNNAFIDGDLTLASNKEVFATNYRVGGYLRFPGSTMGSDVYIYRDDVENMIVDASVSGNTLSLWKRGDPAATPSITFSKATSLSGAWSGGTLTVTASPQGEEFIVNTPVSAAYGDSITVETTPATTGAPQYDLRVDKNYAYIKYHPNANTVARVANPYYADAWAAAYGKVSLPVSASYGSYITIGTPPSTVDGAANSTQYDLTADNNYAYIKYHPNANTVARISIAIAKSEVALTRGSVTTTEPSADAELLKITAKGWYKLSVTVRGVTKTYKLHIDT